MKVELLTHTPNPEWLLSEAYSQCYQKKASIKTIKKHIKHTSVLEHVNYTFSLKMSRVALDQLIRHRIASPTVQSHRYTEIPEEDFFYYIPDEVIALGIEKVDEWIADAQMEYDIYSKWRDCGVKKETARYLAPIGVGISLVWTMNLRSLLNLFTLRLDKHAQEEIRKVVCKMYNLVIKTIPNLKEDLDQMILKEAEMAEGTNPMVGDDPQDRFKFIPADLDGPVIINQKGEIPTQIEMVDVWPDRAECCRPNGDCAECTCPQDSAPQEEPTER